MRDDVITCIFQNYRYRKGHLQHYSVIFFKSQKLKTNMIKKQIIQNQDILTKDHLTVYISKIQEVK